MIKRSWVHLQGTYPAGSDPGGSFSWNILLIEQNFYGSEIFLSLHPAFNISSLVLQTLEQKSEQVLDYHHIII